MAYDPFRSYTGLLDRKRLSIIDGGAAGAHTLAGITNTNPGDRLISVFQVPLPSTPAGTNSAIVTGFAAGAHTVLEAEDTAGEVTIDTGLTAPDAINVMVLRAGVDIHSDLEISISGGNIVVADGATADILEDDVIHWFAFDASDAVLTPVFTGDAGTPAGAAVDLTSEFTISAANEIDNTGGTDTSGSQLFITWEDHDLGETVNPAHLDDA